MPTPQDPAQDFALPSTLSHIAAHLPSPCLPPSSALHLHLSIRSLFVTQSKEEARFPLPASCDCPPDPPPTAGGKEGQERKGPKIKHLVLSFPVTLLEFPCKLSGACEQGSQGPWSPLPHSCWVEGHRLNVPQRPSLTTRLQVSLVSLGRAEGSSVVKGSGREGSP